MLDFLASIEGVTTIVAFVAASWGLYQKHQTSKALRSTAEVQKEGVQQRRALLLKMDQIGEDHEREIDSLNQTFEGAIKSGKEEMALLRGQIGKLMDMIMSGEEIDVEPNGETVSIKGISGEVTMRTATLNKVVEATTSCRYEKSGGMFSKGLKRVVIQPVINHTNDDTSMFLPDKPWSGE